MLALTRLDRRRLFKLFLRKTDETERLIDRIDIKYSIAGRRVKVEYKSQKAFYEREKKML